MDDYTGIQEDNLLTQIWFKPKRTLSYILQNQPEKYVPVLLCLGGIVRAIDRASMKGMGDKMSTITVLVMALVGGGLFGWITYYFYGWLLSVTGRWISGNGSAANFRTVIAWALIPSIFTLLLLLPELLIFGDDLFRSERTNTSTFHDVIWIVFGLLEAVLGTWTIVILVKGVSLVQNFAAGKAIVNILLPGLLIVGPIILLAVLFGAFS